MTPERTSVSRQEVVRSEKGKEPIKSRCFLIKWGRGLQNEIDVSLEDGGRQTVLWVVRGAKVPNFINAISGFRIPDDSECVVEQNGLRANTQFGELTTLKRCHFLKVQTANTDYAYVRRDVGRPPRCTIAITQSGIEPETVKTLFDKTSTRPLPQAAFDQLVNLL